MRIKVFISWSGARSKRLALELQSWLQQVIQFIRPWMSDTDIHIGDRWATSIGESLADHVIGIICVTPENKNAPWLIYEAGALSKTVGESSVCPLLLQMNPIDLQGSPLSQFQAATTKREDILKLLHSLNNKLGEDKLSDDVLVKSFNKNWNDLEDAISTIEQSEIEYNASTLPSIIKVFSKHDFPEPSIDRSAFFGEGFESHQVYEIVTSVAAKRLYNYSRMNRKLLDKEYWSFYENLPSKIEDGFDFKLLFLDPNAPEHVIRSAHNDADFRTHLKQSIEYALNVFHNFGLDPNLYCRTYRTRRSLAMTVVDDAVLYTPIRSDENGVEKKLTKCSFNIIYANSKLGEEMIKDFTTLWEKGGKISESL
jgi:hypothetical protein